METLEECIEYVEWLMRIKTSKMTPDLREDVIADAKADMIGRWGKVKKPVNKMYLRSLYSRFAGHACNRHLSRVDVPRRYTERGIQFENPNAEDQLDKVFPKLREGTRRGVIHALGAFDASSANLGRLEDDTWDGDQASKIIDTEHDNPETLTIQREEIKKILACLTEEEYDIFISVVVAEETGAEIGKRYGVSRQWIMRRFQDIKEKIERKVLHENFSND